MNTLAERLKHAMQIRGVTQAELSKATGASQPSVNAWISGKTKNLKGENLVKVAYFLNVSTDWLANGTGNMSSSWPFYRIKKEDLKCLSQDQLTMIEDLIMMQVSRSKEMVC